MGVLLNCLKPSKKRYTQINEIVIESKEKKELIYSKYLMNLFGFKDLKIDLYPKNIPQGHLEKAPFKDIISNDVLGYSLDINKNLAFLGGNVPLLNGFYTAHMKHYPIRIKPDDIWLLIVQAFSHHVNANSEELRDYFVNFEGKKTLKVKYYGIYYKENITKKILEDFSNQINNQMIDYLGKEILENLTPNFTTTDNNSIIIGKLSIMGTFRSYFNYEMRLCICGIPYVILEGNVEDYIKIKKKAENLSKYKFEWYINRIIPHIEKMIEAKKGNIDNNYFKNFVQNSEITEKRLDGCLGDIYKVTVEYITGWILDFFAYDNNGKRFSDKSLEDSKLSNLASQIITVPFTIIEEKTQKEYNMKYKVGFFGCDQNEKNEVFPVQGWIVSPYH